MHVIRQKRHLGEAGSVTRVGLRTSKSRNEPLYTSNMLNEKLYVLVGSKNASSNSICSVRGTTPGRSRVPSWIIGSHYNKMQCLFDMTKNCIGKLVQIDDTKKVEIAMGSRVFCCCNNSMWITNGIYKGTSEIRNVNANHGEGFACACLSICKNADIMTIQCRPYNWLHLWKDLVCHPKKPH